MIILKNVNVIDDARIIKIPGVEDLKMFTVERNKKQYLISCFLWNAVKKGDRVTIMGEKIKFRGTEFVEAGAIKI